MANENKTRRHSIPNGRQKKTKTLFLRRKPKSTNKKYVYQGRGGRR